MEMDKLEFEQLSHGTRFKNWKTSFRLKMVTGSAHPRQATCWLAEFDQAKSMQDLYDVGFVFGSTRMSFDTLQSQIANGLMKIMNLECKRKVQVAQELQEKKNLPMLTGRQFAFMINVHFKINDVQMRIMSMNDLLNIKFFQRQSQEFRSRVRRIPDATGEGPVPSTVGEVDSHAEYLGGRCVISIKLTAKSRGATRGWKLCSQTLEDWQQHSVTAHKEKRPTGKDQIANIGHRKARAQEAQKCAFKHDEEREREI